MFIITHVRDERAGYIDDVLHDLRSAYDSDTLPSVSEVLAYVDREGLVIDDHEPADFAVHAVLVDAGVRLSD